MPAPADADLVIEPGEFIVILRPSGFGKSAPANAHPITAMEVTWETDGNAMIALTRKLLRNIQSNAGLLISGST